MRRATGRAPSGWEATTWPERYIFLIAKPCE